MPAWKTTFTYPDISNPERRKAIATISDGARGSDAEDMSVGVWKKRLSPEELKLLEDGVWTIFEGESSVVHTKTEPEYSGHRETAANKYRLN